MKKRVLLSALIIVTSILSLTARPGTAVTILSSNLQAQVEAGEDTSIVFNYDDDGANEKNGWIEVYFDGKQARFCAGTELEAPLNFDIPGQVLKPGEHKVEFMIMAREDGEQKAITKTVVLLEVIE